MSLCNSDQFYWLDRVGTGSTRVRKVRHKFNSQVNIRTIVSLTHRNRPVKKLRPMQARCLMFDASTQSLVQITQTSSKFRTDGPTSGRLQKSTFKWNSAMAI